MEIVLIPSGGAVLNVQMSLCECKFFAFCVYKRTPVVCVGALRILLSDRCGVYVSNIYQGNDQYQRTDDVAVISAHIYMRRRISIYSKSESYCTVFNDDLSNYDCFFISCGIYVAAAMSLSVCVSVCCSVGAVHFLT